MDTTIVINSEDAVGKAVGHVVVVVVEVAAAAAADDIVAADRIAVVVAVVDESADNESGFVKFSVQFHWAAGPLGHFDES